MFLFQKKIKKKDFTPALMFISVFMSIVFAASVYFLNKRIHYLRYHLNIAQQQLHQIELSTLTAEKIQRGKNVNVKILSDGVIFNSEISFEEILSDPLYALSKIPTESTFNNIGSGVILNPEKGFIITAAHVVANKEAHYKIQVIGQEYFDAELIFEDIENDFALLQVKEDLSSFEPLFLAHESLGLGTEIVSFGQDEMYFGRIIQENVDIKSEKKAANFSFINTKIQPGDSGGAVMDFKGRLVGINTAFVNDEEKSFILPASKIMEILTNQE